MRGTGFGEEDDRWWKMMRTGSSGEDGLGGE